ncbi:hypothetical protein ALQ88_03583 [Pseudomonas savastanoi]|nr:hypothetical protein ALQ88_03583 [Pseudomonas savastanoi]
MWFLSHRKGFPRSKRALQTRPADSYIGGGGVCRAVRLHACRDMVGQRVCPRR